MELLNYVTTEGAGTVEVCANITRGSIDCDIRAALASTDGPKAGTCINNCEQSTCNEPMYNYC